MIALLAVLAAFVAYALVSIVREEHAAGLARIRRDGLWCECGCARRFAKITGWDGYHSVGRAA